MAHTHTQLDIANIAQQYSTCEHYLYRVIENKERRKIVHIPEHQKNAYCTTMEILYHFFSRRGYIDFPTLNCTATQNKAHILQLKYTHTLVLVHLSVCLSKEFYEIFIQKGYENNVV